MRCIAIVVCSAALAVSGTAAQAQSSGAAAAKTPAATGVTHLMLPPVPKALLPEVFAGWVAASAPKKTDRRRPGRPCQRGGSQGVRLYRRRAGPTTSASGETLSLRALRFHDASGAYGAYSFYRQNGWPKEEIGSGRDLEPQPCALLGGQYRGGCELLAHRPHVGRGAARAGRPVAAARGRQGAAAADSGQPAAGIAGRADDALCAGTGGLCRRGRRAAAGAGGLRSRRGGRDGQLLAALRRRPRSPSSTTPRRRWPPRRRPRFAPTSRPAASRRSLPGPSRCWTPTWPRSRCGRSGPLVALVSGDAIPDESHKLLAIGSLRGGPDVDPAAHRIRGGQDRQAADRHRFSGASLAAAQPFCWDFSWAAAGRSIALRAANRPRRSTTSSSSSLNLRE